jgi:omega-6 fatty acid desaturase (delta-12 desaturase)
MAPLSWPYNGWMVTHNHHHAYTNNLDKDHLWHPLMKETVTKLCM